MNNTKNDGSNEKNDFDEDPGDRREVNISDQIGNSIEVWEKEPIGDSLYSKPDDPDDDDIIALGIEETLPKKTNETENASPVTPTPSDNTDSEEMPEILEDDPESLLIELRNIGKRIDQLTTHFEDKIKYDEHKNQIIDDLHSQLQSFRDGIIKKHMLSMIMDIIKIIDDTRKFKSHYESSAQQANTTEILLDFLDQITLDLEELFSLQGIYPFTCTSRTFDSSRQRIIKKIETSDIAENKLLAKRLRPGYEWEGKVIRPEMVSIYIYTDTTNDKADIS